MSLDFDFSSDTEFTKLLEWRTDIDLIVAALELARDAYPNLDFATTQHWVDARVAELRSSVRRATNERDAVETVARHLSLEHGILGSVAAYKDPDASYLNRIIEKRHGIPISLTLLHMAVCQKLGVDLQPVGSPRHFLSRVDTVDGPLFLDAFAGCRLMDENETLEWLSALSNLPLEDIARQLKPVAPRAIITRMLNNLKVIYADRDNWDATWRVQYRLTALGRGDYAERRDLAIVAVKAQRFGTAIHLLKSLLKTCPSEDRPVLLDQLKLAEGSIHLWN